MFDISQQERKVNCPECKAINIVTLKQVADEEGIKCSGCSKEINLKDGDGSTKQALASVARSLDDLENTIKGFGRG